MKWVTLNYCNYLDKTRVESTMLPSCLPNYTITPCHSLKRQRHLKDRLNKSRKLPEVPGEGGDMQRPLNRSLVEWGLCSLWRPWVYAQDVEWPLRWSWVNLKCMLLTQLVLVFSTPLRKVWPLLETITHEMWSFVESKFCPICWKYLLHQCLLFQRNETQKVPFCPICIYGKKYF